MIHFKSEQLLPIDIERAWNFFSSPWNLRLITPPGLDFRIVTRALDNEIYEGMTIDYTLKPLFGLPVKWRSEISSINRPFEFTDSQLKGPYKIWIHKHSFLETANGTLIKDEISYQLPYGKLGLVAHSFLVKARIEKIFNYRFKTLQKMFN